MVKRYEPNDWTYDNDGFYRTSCKRAFCFEDGNIRENGFVRHEVKRFLQKIYGYVRFYFKTTNDYRDVEKLLIKHYQPEFNKQWR